MATETKPKPPAPQFVGDKRVNRLYHVWLILEGDLCKCVVCGAMTRTPTVDDLAEAYLPVTEYEKQLCPFEGK